MYALKIKGSFKFICVSKDAEELETRVHQEYFKWRDNRPKWGDNSRDAFLVGYETVEVTVDPCLLDSEAARLNFVKNDSRAHYYGHRQLGIYRGSQRR